MWTLALNVAAVVGVVRVTAAGPGDPAAPLPGWAGALGARPVVYVSLGTVPLFNQPPAFQALLEGLADEDAAAVAGRLEAAVPVS